VPAPFISEPRAPEPTLPSLGAVVFPRAGFSSTESLVLLNLVVAGVLMFLWKENYRVELMHLLRQWFAKVDHGSYQYAVPTIFMHADPKHLFMNMASLLASSAAVEYLFGRWKAVAGYVITGLGGAALSFVNRSGPPISIGASGAIFGFAGLLTIFLVRHYRNLTVRQKWKTRRIYAPLLVLLFLPSLFHADGWAHLGGLGTGLALGLIFPPSRWIREHMRWSSRPPQRPPDETPELVLR
jgi:membrane associated rhomboid family serine protease